jgi:hypothetical protein
MNYKFYKEKMKSLTKKFYFRGLSMIYLVYINWKLKDLRLLRAIPEIYLFRYKKMFQFSVSWMFWYFCISYP